MGNITESDKEFSLMDIGAADYSRVEGGEEAVEWLNVDDEFFWKITLEGFKVGNNTL
jgi:hypothetical protein